MQLCSSELLQFFFNRGAAAHKCNWSHSTIPRSFNVRFYSRVSGNNGREKRNLASSFETFFLTDLSCLASSDIFLPASLALLVFYIYVFHSFKWHFHFLQSHNRSSTTAIKAIKVFPSSALFVGPQKLEWGECHSNVRNHGNKCFGANYSD